MIMRTIGGVCALDKNGGTEEALPREVHVRLTRGGGGNMRDVTVMR